MMSRFVEAAVVVGEVEAVLVGLEARLLTVSAAVQLLGSPGSTLRPKHTVV
jgi:hypothetical protein